MSFIELSHGGGGKHTEELLKKVFMNSYNNDVLADMEDSAAIYCDKSNLAFTTDSYTITPLFFRGGDIGKLAVCGTVNDLLMRGAQPLFLSASFIIEEGFEINKLQAIANSMDIVCKEAGVAIVTGDTKVVEKGKADKVFINTSGIGVMTPDTKISIKRARPGDVVIISGTIGDHGMSILSIREDFAFEPPIKSDCAPLGEIVENILQFKEAVRVLRDPTRGGVAEVLYNIAKGSSVGIEIDETKLPVRPQVQAACDMLGLDFLHLANEGKLLAVVDPEVAYKILDVIKGSKYGSDATVIGKINDSGLITIRTRLKTSRILDRPMGELIPRIC